MVTELGGTRYEHVHIHGIMTLSEDQEKELTKIWAYGFVYIGYACNNESEGVANKTFGRNQRRTTKTIHNVDVQHRSTAKTSDRHDNKRVRTGQQYSIESTSTTHGTMAKKIQKIP